MKCKWCKDLKAKPVNSTVYWELPDGTRAIEIKDTPGIKCSSCGMEYQEDSIIETIEDHLLLIDTSKLGTSTTFEKLMQQPKLLKRNYFKFN